MSNSYSTDRFTELATGYVLESLSKEEQEEFEALLEEANEEQLQLYHDLKEAVSYLALLSRPETPTESVKKRLLEEIGSKEEYTTGSVEVTGEPSEDEGTKVFGLLTPSQAAAVLIATLLLLLSSIFYSFNLYWQLSEKNEQLSQIENRVVENEKLLRVLSSPRIKTVMMNGKEFAEKAHGKLIWDPVNMEALLQISKLPPLPETQHYQLWLMRGDNVQSVTKFTVQDTSRDKFFQIDKLADRYEAANATFAITRETSQSPKEPSGKIVLIGKHQAPSQP